MRDLNRMLFARISNLLLEPGEQEAKQRGQTWIFVDELRRAGKLPGLVDVMVEGRSKGACCVLGFQDVGGLWEVYSKDEANEIIGACGNKVFLQTADQVTAEYASKHFQDQEENDEETSYKHDASCNMRCRFNPAEIIYRPVFGHKQQK